MSTRSTPLLPALLLLGLTLFAPPAWGQGTPAAPLDHLFGSRTQVNHDLTDLPQWLKALTRHQLEDRADRPVLKEWLALLTQLQDKPRLTQLQQVNSFINRKAYILDSVNYGVDDYWAVVREFMALSGDCEDFSISKFFSLRQLGFPADSLRIVILQDTNLGIAHAVLAVAYEGGALILDNQTNEIMPDQRIIHYTPLYSVNEQQWWLHLPPVN
jgi:predicted transglutaminase-like cysteine proteinase